jgi:hypothetical protein
MWEFSGAGEARFLIIARSDRDPGGGPIQPGNLPPELRVRLILYGALRTLDEAQPAGVALAVEAPDRNAVAAFVEDRRTGLDGFQEIEIHNWEFGGRR